MTGRGPRARALAVLATVALLLWNFPLLAVWDRDATLFGLPLLPVALFAIWGGLIAALALLGRRPPGAGGRKRGGR